MFLEKGDVCIFSRLTRRREGEAAEGCFAIERDDLADSGVCDVEGNVVSGKLIGLNAEFDEVRVIGVMEGEEAVGGVAEWFEVGDGFEQSDAGVCDGELGGAVDDAKADGDVGVAGLGCRREYKG